MNHLKTIFKPAEKQEVLDFVTCDLCGERIRRAGAYDVDEVEIARKTGVSYPEGSWGTTTAVDMCGKCFEKKLVPWLRAQGADPRTEEWDW